MLASALLKDGSAVYTPGLLEHRGITSKFYHADALGSTRGITDSSQSVTDSLRYDALGRRGFLVERRACLEAEPGE